jgi:integrase
MSEGNGKVSSTRTNITAYGKGRTRRWRWSARVWREGSEQSEQIRRQGFATEQDAREDAERVLVAIRNGKTATVPAAPDTITLGAAIDRLLVEKTRRKTVNDYRNTGEHLKAAFGADTPLTAITSAKISAYRAQRIANPSAKTGRPLKAAGVNGPLALLRHLLKVANQEWELLREVPRVRLVKPDQGRLRWLTREEATRLLEALGRARNPDVLDLTILALGTGCRRSELLELTWDRVDRARGVIRLELTKSGKRREVPFGRDVDAVLARRQQASTRVFQRASWEAYRYAFESAVVAAKIDDFRFHDLRHTYASWLVQAGRPLAEVQALLGHRTLAMTNRYSHLAPENLRIAVSALDGVLGAVTGSVSATPAPAKEPVASK